MNAVREKFFSGITRDFEVMSKMVIKQIHLTQQLLEDNRKEDTYTEIQSNERILDSLDVKMRNEVIRVIVLYSPRAGDLRKIMSYYDMTAYLERIGDLIVNISNFLKRIELSGETFPPFKKDMVKILSIAENMTQNAIFAFTCEDAKLARETIELDDLVDAFHHEIVRKLPVSHAGKNLQEQQITDILSISSISYNIERIGDNATNIAEAAIYLMEGKNIKHSGLEESAPLQAGSEG